MSTQTELKPQAYPARIGELFSFQGRLAQAWGSTDGPDDPIRKHHIRYSRIDADECRHLIGQVPWSPSGDFSQGQLRGLNGGRLTIDTNGWMSTDVLYPIPKPRNGKTFTWVWSNSLTRAWVRKYFDLCSECRKQHDPTFEHCTWCGSPVRNVRFHLNTNPHCREALS